MFFCIFIIIIVLNMSNQLSICNNFEFYNVMVKECISCTQCDDLNSNNNCHGCCKPEFWFDNKVHDCHPCSECESFEDRRMCESQCRKNSSNIKCKKKEWFDLDNKFCQSCVKCDNPQTCAYDCFNSSDCADNQWYDVVSHACESCTDCKYHSTLCINQCEVNVSTILPIITEIQNDSYSSLVSRNISNTNILFPLYSPMKIICGIFISIVIMLLFYKLKCINYERRSSIYNKSVFFTNNPGISEKTSISGISAMESNETTNTENDSLISDSRTGNSHETQNEAIAISIVDNEAIQNQQEINRNNLNLLPRPIHPEITLSRNISDETQNEAIANPIVYNEAIQNQNEINRNNLNLLPRPIHPEITLSRNISDETQNEAIANPIVNDENIQNHQERNNINLVSPMPRPIDPESTPIRNNSVIAHPTNDQNSARFYNTRTIL